MSLLNALFSLVGFKVNHMYITKNLTFRTVQNVNSYITIKTKGLLSHLCSLFLWALTHNSLSLIWVSSIPTQQLHEWNILSPRLPCTCTTSFKFPGSHESTVLDVEVRGMFLFPTKLTSVSAPSHKLDLHWSQTSFLSGCQTAKGLPKGNTKKSCLGLICSPLSL